MLCYKHMKRERERGGSETQVKHIESGEGAEQKSEKIQSHFFTTLEKGHVRRIVEEFNTLQNRCKNRSTAALSFPSPKFYSNLIPAGEESTINDVPKQVPFFLITQILLTDRSGKPADESSLCSLISCLICRGGGVEFSRIDALKNDAQS